MAHFLAEIQGQRGAASRLGSKKTGITSHTASWEGCVYVSLTYDEKTGQDMAYVCLRPWHGRGISKVLYDGPIGGKE